MTQEPSLDQTPLEDRWLDIQYVSHLYTLPGVEDEESMYHRVACTITDALNRLPPERRATVAAKDLIGSPCTEKDPPTHVKQSFLVNELVLTGILSMGPDLPLPDAIPLEYQHPPGYTNDPRILGGWQERAAAENEKQRWEKQGHAIHAGTASELPEGKSAYRGLHAFG